MSLTIFNLKSSHISLNSDPVRFLVTYVKKQNGAQNCLSHEEKKKNYVTTAQWDMFLFLGCIRSGIYFFHVSSAANFSVRNVRNALATNPVLTLMCQNTAYDSYRKISAFPLLT